ncbi:hypothetical protein [Haladaptatus sp. DJG-WS-42]|uniref:hypothetical protein n=1 Tax=Haladaptatus sp. DJG-WS-42 TaxID=3120516 RepID=UPI0030D1526B
MTRDDRDIFDKLAAETSHEVQDPLSELDEESLTDAEASTLADDDLWDALADTDDMTITNGSEELEEAVVEKQAFCESCEHFTAPPEVGCTHDGTKILEQTDMRHFKVRNCPVVAQRRELEAER